MTLSESNHPVVEKATQVVMNYMSHLDFNISVLFFKEMAMSRTLFYSRLKSLTGRGPDFMPLFVYRRQQSY